MWRSKVSSWDLVFSFHHADMRTCPRNLTQDLRLGNTYFYLLSLLPAFNDAVSLLIVVLGMKPRPLCAPDKHPAPELYVPPAPRSTHFSRPLYLTRLCSTLTFDLRFSWAQNFRLHFSPRIIFQLITFVFRQFPFHNAYQPLTPHLPVTPSAPPPLYKALPHFHDYFV